MLNPVKWWRYLHLRGEGSSARELYEKLESAESGMRIWNFNPYEVGRDIDEVCPPVEDAYDELQSRQDGQWGSGSAEMRLLRIAAIHLQLACEGYAESEKEFFETYPTPTGDVGIGGPTGELFVDSWQKESDQARYQWENGCGYLYAVAYLLEEVTLPSFSVACVEP